MANARTATNANEKRELGSRCMKDHRGIHEIGYSRMKRSMDAGIDAGLKKM